MTKTGSRPAVIVVAHGSRAAGSSQPVVEFVEHVRESPGVADAFERVDIAYLQHGTPPIARAVHDTIDAGCSQVLVAPLLLTVSTHATEDLPALLGHDAPPGVRERLVEAGQELLPPGLPVRLLGLPPMTEILTANVLRRLDLRTKRPLSEAVVLCAYGSGIYHDRWERLLGDLGRWLLQRGYGHARHAYVGPVVGHSPQPTIEAIERAGAMPGIRLVHVVPVLMSQSLLHQRVIGPAVERVDGQDRFSVSYAADAILPDGDLAAMVANTALRAIDAFPTVDRGARA